MNICLFDKTEINSPLKANDERAKHIIKILHKSKGDSFDAGIINGKAGIATIEDISDDGEISFSFEEKSDGKPLYPLTLIIGFPRPIQLRRLLRDVAGLGAAKIILTGTELGEKSYMNSNDVKDGAAEKMLLDGTVQAASTHVPELILVQTLKEAIELTNGANVVKCALDNRRAKKSLGTFLSEEICGGEKTVVAAIGSERGWTERERDFLESYGYTLCSMGKRVLRTESATTVAASIILDRMGFLD